MRMFAVLASQNSGISTLQTHQLRPLLLVGVLNRGPMTKIWPVKEFQFSQSPQK